MAKITLRCPSCAGKFTVDIDAQPRFCVLCGYDTAEDTAAKNAAFADMLESQTPPHYAAKTIVKSVDTTYAALEESSAARASAAASAAGVPEDEMSSLKITNMHDNLRPGDIAAYTASTEVGQTMAAHPNVTGLQAANPQINQYKAGVRTGLHANAGIGTMRALQGGHSSRRAAVEASGTHAK